jgi:hypothetical protein
MNSFKLNIKNDGNPGVPEYYIKLKVDGDEFLKQIDEDFNVVFFEELVESGQDSGKFLIFTCSCGSVDFGGCDYVKVSHESDKIIWDFNYEKAFHFEFNIDSYKKEIEKDDRGIIIEPINVIERQ